MMVLVNGSEVSTFSLAGSSGVLRFASVFHTTYSSNMSQYPTNNPQYPGYPPPLYPQPPGYPQQPYMPPGAQYPGLYPQIPGPGFNVEQHVPAAMSYPGVASAPSAPFAPGIPPGVAPGVAPTPVYPGAGWVASAPSAPFAPGIAPGVAPGVAPTPVFSEAGYAAPSPVEWIPSNSASAEVLTQRAVVAGYEGHDGSPLWVIRCFHEGDLIPGKLAIKHKSAYIPWGGKENSVQQFEVCCAPPNRVKWVEGRNGTVPQNAVPAGRTSTGEPLYVGRAKEQGSLTPGKIHPSHKTCYISFGGDEISHPVYEVLCVV